MKKNILIALLLAFIFSFKTTQAQDMSEAQRKERCENNKKRITELEGQLNILNADLSQAWTKKEIQDAKNQLVYLYGLYDSKTSYPYAVHPTEQSVVQRYAAKYNYKAEDCFKNGKVFQNECIYRLIDIINEKIYKANSLNRAEIVNKKNDIPKQIAFHKNNLIVLGCNENSIGTNANWNGIFVDSYGSVSISSSGTSMSASFTSQGPENNWKNVGQWSGCKVNGNTAKCNWTCSYSDDNKTGTRKGTLEVTLSGNTISGSVYEDTPSFNWKPGITDKYTKMQKGAVWPINMKRK